MDLNALLTISQVVLPILAGGIGFFIKSLYKRVDILEDKISRAMTREDVRIVIDDKLNPIQVELNNISRRLDLIEKEQSLIFMAVMKLQSQTNEKT